MLFLKISNVDMSFSEKTLMWKSYTTNKALLTIQQVEIVNPKEFVMVTLNVNNKTFVVYVAIQKQEKMPVHSKKQAQVRALLFKNVFTKVLAEYSNYSNVFSVKNTAKLPENIKINKHIIKLEESK